MSSTFDNLHIVSSGHILSVADVGSLPAIGVAGDIRYVISANVLYTFDGASWNPPTAVNFSGPLAGDVTGTQSATAVDLVGGSTAANVHAAELLANAATNANTASTIVKRDGSGDFTAGTITASLTGHASLDVPLSQVGASNGVASLDSGGKVPIGQLPSTVMEYQGAWDASTNTPTLIDGTGKAGDVYRASVAGTQDLGSGSQTWAVGDLAIYNGTIWQHCPAADGVSSVNGNTGAVTINAINTLTSDVTTATASGSQSLAATVAAVGGSTAALVHAAELLANAATNANTASTLVKRDPSGNFTAGTITANLTGNASGTSANVTGIVAAAHGGLGADGSAYTGVVKASSGTFSAASLVNADVDAAAAIDGTKISPNFGSQTVQTSGPVQLNDSGSSYVKLQAPATASGYTLSLPTGAGSVGQVMQTSGAGGLLSWVTPVTSASLNSRLDNVASKQAVDLASTANIASLSGETTIDGIATFSSLVLLKNQTDNTQNGIWQTGVGAWLRSGNMPDNIDSSLGAIVSVDGYGGGTANNNTLWYSNSDDSGAMPFVQIPTTASNNVITASRALTTNATSQIAPSATTATELGYVSGVTSALQTQLNAKASTTLTSAHLLIGNGSNVATDTAVTGDVTISNAGVTAIGTGKVTSTMILDGTIVDADINASAAIAGSKIAVAVAGVSAGVMDATGVPANATGTTLIPDGYIGAILQGAAKVGTNGRTYSTISTTGYGTADTKTAFLTVNEGAYFVTAVFFGVNPDASTKRLFASIRIGGTAVVGQYVQSVVASEEVTMCLSMPCYVTAHGVDIACYGQTSASTTMSSCTTELFIYRIG